MQELNQALSKVVTEIQEQQNLGVQLNPTLLPEETQMLHLKYKSKLFCIMPPHELIKCAKVLLLKISVITGWILPDDNLDLLIDAFAKKILLSYSNANADEVEYAFITEASSVKDWGKHLNIGLIDEIMIPYLSKRFEVSRLEEQLKKPKLIEQPKEDLSEKAMADWWKDVEFKVRNQNYKKEFVPVALYDWLDKQGGISLTAQEKRKYLDAAVKLRHLQLVKKYEDNSCEENKKTLSDFNKMKEDRVLTGDEVERCKNLSKRMIIYDYMLK